MECSGVLSGVVAHVVSFNEGCVDSRRGLEAKLRGLGAEVRSRMSKQITHVVFHRKPHPSAEQAREEDDCLRRLLSQDSKSNSVSVVKASWVEACFERQKRAPEREYAVSPSGTLLDFQLTKTPGSTARKKKRKVQQPKPEEHYNLDMGAMEFSSTQQMMLDEPPEGLGEDRTYPGSAEAAAKIVQREKHKDCRPSTAPPGVRKQAGSRHTAHDLSCDARHSEQCSTGTQAVAEALLGLPQGLGASPSTPLNAFQACGKAGGGRAYGASRLGNTPDRDMETLAEEPSPADSHDQQPAAQPVVGQKRPISAPLPRPPHKRQPPRLGQMSRLRPRSAVPSKWAPAKDEEMLEAHVPRRPRSARGAATDADSDDDMHDMMEHGYAAHKRKAAHKCCTRCTAPREAADKLQGAPSLQQINQKSPAVQQQPAGRAGRKMYDVTQDFRYELARAAQEYAARRMALLQAAETPHGASPGQQLDRKSPTEQQRQQQEAGTAGGAQVLAAGRAACAQVQQQADEDAVGPAARAVPHAQARQQPATPREQSGEGTSGSNSIATDVYAAPGGPCEGSPPTLKLQHHAPTPGLECGTGYIKMVVNGFGNKRLTLVDEADQQQTGLVCHAGPPGQVAPAAEKNRKAFRKQKAAAAHCGRKAGRGGPAQPLRGQENASGAANAQNDMKKRTPAGKGADVRTTKGFLAVSSVTAMDAKNADLCLMRLRKLRKCPDDKEEQITHLVLGAERTTFKVYMAIAQGAWILTPAWLTTSLEAGEWQSEEDFQAEFPFVEAAARARAHYEEGKPRLLAGESVCLAEPKPMPATLRMRCHGIKRLAAVHGAKVATARHCTICILANEETAIPATLPDSAMVVNERWLLSLTEEFRLPPADSPWIVTSC